MNTVTHLNQIFQVKKRRQFGYATVDLINQNGSIRKRDKTIVVRFPKGAVEAAQVGSLWQISGKERLSSFVVNDIHVTEYNVDADEIKYLRPSGQILARWISSNIKGVGSVIANRLVRLKDLNTLVKTRNREALLSVAGMSKDRVEALFDKWPDDGLYETIEWLESHSLPLDLGNKLVNIFGALAIDRIKEHPFFLMAMGVSFNKTMEICQMLGLDMDDQTVQSGVAQHVAVTYSSRTKSTLIEQQTLVDESSKVLGIQAPNNIGNVAVDNRLLVSVGGAYQVWGTALMEASVAKFLFDAHTRLPGTLALLAGWEKYLTRESVASALHEHQLTLGFKLTKEQTEAIIGAVMSPVASISGGAGTGKTTILNAICAVYECLSEGLEYFQVALSGRAAQRMSESTGRPAQTIAKFISEHVGEGKPELPPHLLLVIDEASMVDLLSMYKLIGILPQATRILFVGDTSQLPPVGGGLVFHALAGTNIPMFNLTQVKRQSDQSPIYHFALSVRNNCLTMPPPTRQTLGESAACSIDQSANIERIIQLWREAGGIENCIVLSPVRKGALGVVNLNKAIQTHLGSERPALNYKDPQKGWIPWITSDGVSLLEGDAVLVTANNYDDNADVRNGDLGILSEVYSQVGSDGALGILKIGDQEIPITFELLEKLSLGYAITVHKSQGSQWPTCLVVIPHEARQMLDQTLLYTACTRPSDRLVILGSSDAIDAAMRKGSLALKRRTFLKERLLSLQENF
ncbi:ATP-dependent RecD-like DNA helicase [Alteromonas sp. McT4-15]|uniref:AAA family ATPase n=1 Tax=Alteromonas sp. McT4-15 TaxID=2881256 RepID=UPI001CF8AD55|nr:AAA family ATPase [Alteromonas sp. McT4-15]MCB4438266.1 ATP-dependent RecD-like DNA helicase [Alteromonas sp. McT4-15]